VYTSARDHLPDTKVGGQTATPSGPTASRRRAAARLCVPPVATVVEVNIVVPLPTRADLYLLLQCGEDSE
jgi:hypothetical protein